tara:strand:+ start:185 stop:397 length:213 start_codon:yes stop_codon:yes gene_type:complete
MVIVCQPFLGSVLVGHAIDVNQCRHGADLRCGKGEIQESRVGLRMRFPELVIRAFFQPGWLLGLIVGTRH